MGLRDLRAYFARNCNCATWCDGNCKKPCGAEKPEPGPQLGWLCTLAKGHSGSHIAHDIDGTLITRWPA